MSNDKFINQLENLVDNLEIRARSFYKTEGKNSVTGNALHTHIHNIRDLIERWKND